ncbi:serine carboxypeptidase [Aureococcus anophagefferens]|nr:serine carboxypeptidase [Aureococcus anophagefferens]
MNAMEEEEIEENVNPVLKGRNFKIQNSDGGAHHEPPGRQTPSPQYSGWLKGGNATSGGMSTLHYWFAAYEGKDDWRTKPVVLWLNGGPGSSSLLGFMGGGPAARPGGVGFSYCEAQKTGGHCGWTDKTTAKANANAVRDFFVKFPELDNDFFITGEHAGVYCPTLARELVDGNDAARSRA